MAFVISRFQFRISTALLCAGILLLPWTSTLLDGPRPALPGESIRELIDVTVMYVGPQLFFLAFLFALVRLGCSIWQRRWVGTIQPMTEMALCFLALLFIPTY